MIKAAKPAQAKVLLKAALNWLFPQPVKPHLFRGLCVLAKATTCKDLPVLERALQTPSGFYLIERGPAHVYHAPCEGALVVGQSRYTACRTHFEA
jgi:hypothetical protein